jgi:EAL domain-containing protein (putative c-di-GMP-specific phosphodiesterase class I)
LPFSELKIDRSYVSNCHGDKVNGGLCETIVKLAKRFELMTVAEGIEKSAESDKLKEIGCDIGQGYLFAKPMPKAEFVAALSRRLVGPPKRPAKQRVAVTTLTRGALADT